MTDPDPGQEAPLEERLEDHLDRCVAELTARALRGDFDNVSGVGLARVAGRISELLSATHLLEGTRPRGERFVDAVAYAHRDNSRRREAGEDVRCGCRLTADCVSLDVSPRLLARLCGFDEAMDTRLTKLDVAAAKYDPGGNSLKLWQAVNDLELLEVKVAPRARERLATALMWALCERLAGQDFELGEAAAALSDLGWVDQELPDEFCDAVTAAHDHLHTPEQLEAWGLRPGPGVCACRTTATCHSSTISPRSVVRQLVQRGLIKELDDPGLDQRLLDMDVTGMPDPADATTSPPPATPQPAVVAPAPVAQRASRRRDPEQAGALQAEILAVLRASPSPLAAREIAAMTDGDRDGRRAGQLLRRLRERGLVERHSFSDENTGWMTTTWTATEDDEQW